MTILKFNAFEFRTSKKWKGGVFFIKKINIFFFNNSFPRFPPYKSLFYIKGDFKVNFFFTIITYKDKKNLLHSTQLNLKNMILIRYHFTNVSYSYFK